ncbi:T3SS effector HopA1 family protein [Chamaesiphon sp. OTE_8_metabat_110]|uniref:T3SS effector HopA1 family protein n=1 Tax=Chamaesiphon sp. OTE_8_metabat_110 TaxID=2964696 RepID=UPI00286AD3EC|nr:T3SS effector HopA1 family protein [Chamaesiphon sp. OTE_8_metabat_110]
MSIFMQKLVEIVETIAIDPDLTIAHPHYPPTTIEPDLRARFTQIPHQLQQKFLTDRVRNYLYDLYFTGSKLPIDPVDPTSQILPAQLSDRFTNGIDLNFYRRLQQSNTSRGYLDLNWQIVAVAEDRELIVAKDGLHVHVDLQQHVPPNLHQAKIGDTIPIYLPHNLVGIDTYIMVGNAGSPQHDERQFVRVYFNITPDAAVTIAAQLTAALNKLGIRFEFAILHHPHLFCRYDAATLWLTDADYLAIQTTLIAIYQAHQTEFSPQVPLFTKQLAPGLGLAQMPPATNSFGQHRCELVAEGLVTAFLHAQTSTTDKLARIEAAWHNVQLDWHQPYLNSSSRDDYATYATS